MADCRKHRELISAYADGELSENEKNELLGHLEECASCRSLLSLYKSISGAAAESLREPPDNFADSIMEKIRMLPVSEKTNKPMAHKPKSTRPVVISFVAAVACLALAFIVSPQLFGFGGTSNTASSMPMASAAYGTASEAALDNSAQDSVMKASESAVAGGTAEAGGSTAPEGKTVITGTTESPQPAPSQPPDIVYAREGLYDLKNYYAVFVITGQLPDAVTDYGMTDNKDGTFSIVISIETANQLINDSFEVEMGPPEALEALVIYTPPQ